MEILRIHTPWIRLDQAMKLLSWVSSGAEAKIRIQEGETKVNGEICLMRGKKLADGTIIGFQGREARIVVKS